MNLLSNIRIEAYDRRIAAIHEAGHVIIGQILGFTVYDVKIFKTFNGDEFSATWIGNIETCGGFWLPKHKRSMFGVSGYIAECAWLRNDEWDIGLLDENAMSETDWALLGCHPGNPDEEARRAGGEVWDLLNPDDGRFWFDLCRIANRLIREAAIPRPV